MKKVVLKEKKGVYIDDLTNDSVVGIVCSDVNYTKLLVVKKNENEFVGFNNNKLDLSSTWSANTLQNFVKEIRNVKKIFIFDTNTEALKWLSKKKQTK